MYTTTPLANDNNEQTKDKKVKKSLKNIQSANFFKLPP